MKYLGKSAEVVDVSCHREFSGRLCENDSKTNVKMQYPGSSRGF
jgi:hypothetical protein